jgi:hypothetical protein
MSSNVGLFDMFDQMVAEGLGVDIQTYIDTIDLFSDEDMETIIHTTLNMNATEDERMMVRNLFKSRMTE